MTKSEMIMDEAGIKALKDKIDRGICLAQKRLVEKTKRENSYLVVAKDGKIIRLYSKDL